MLTQQTHYTEGNKDYWHCVKTMSWGAVFAGALVAVGLGFLFSLLNLGLGISALNTNQSLAAIAVGGLVWLIICSIVTMFIAGWVSGKLAFTYGSRCNKGMLYGFVTWSLALVLSILVTAHVSKLIRTTSYFSPTTVAYVTNVPPTMAATGITKVNSDAVVVDAKTVASNAAKGAFSTFFIFLLGAIASCIGGCLGYHSRMKYCDSVKQCGPKDEIRKV